MKIHYAGHDPTASGFGWATCNENLRSELGRLCKLVESPFPQETICAAGALFGRVETHAPDVVFMPLADHAFRPVSCARGAVNIAYSFFESPLEAVAAENAKKYDTVFVGSTWCLERMQEAGITNGKVLIQGVDHDIFKAQPRRKPDGQFRIFSGGKFEYRKGQDLVIAAFREFSKKHDDARLVCSWFNPWPHIMISMEKSYFLRRSTAFAQPYFTDPKLYPQGLMLEDLLNEEGIDDFTILPQQDQGTLAAEMANTDIGLFPNRCEGGTNLVLMEYASVGRKIIANAKTGHADISGAISYEIPATTDENHWAVQEADDIVAMLELAYENRDTPEHWSKSGHAKSWTWKAAAETIVEEARRLL